MYNYIYSYSIFISVVYLCIIGHLGFPRIFRNLNFSLRNVIIAFFYNENRIVTTRPSFMKRLEIPIQFFYAFLKQNE